MKRKAPKYNPSPNEEARLVQEEFERRRKLRIQQVREQQRVIALNIRQNVERRRQRELEQLGEELREEWERQQAEKVCELQRLYQESLQLLGQGHRNAKENEPDLAAIAQKEVENQAKAEERFREALRELKSQRLKDSEKQNRAINARNKALQMEKERAAKVASLPPPPPHPSQSIDSMKPHALRKWDLQAFASTHYHMPQATVDRETDEQQGNANRDAELEMRRLQELQEDERRRREEQLEKAQLRGQQALRREQLVQDRERMMVELEHMQQTDLLRRRQQVSQMPPQIFQPLYKRQEMRQDFQRDMELAFEDERAEQRRVKGDLVAQLVPEPLPAPSTESQDQELDVTLDETGTSGAEAAPDDEQEEERPEQEMPIHVEPVRPAPRQALRKLLDRIRNQRTNYIAEASAPGSSTDSQVPERDTSIDTGSLTSEERGKSSAEVPAQQAAEVEPMEQLNASDAPPADVSPPDDARADRIQELGEQQREEELERARVQQITLLKELEEQKAKLEQMLLEAQEERDDLRAAVNRQEASTKQPDVIAHDQDVSQGAQPIPESEDEDTRRIRAYQQRLLEQNKIHQRSVEVARQRLEEYQRALRIRHSLTAGFQPPYAAPRLAPLLPHGASRCTQLPTQASSKAADRLHLDTRVPDEIPTRESDVSPSPPSSFSLGSDQRKDISAMATSSIMERFNELLSRQQRPELQEAWAGAESKQEEDRRRRELDEEEKMRRDLHQRQEEERLRREREEAQEEERQRREHLERMVQQRQEEERLRREREEAQEEERRRREHLERMVQQREEEERRKRELEEARIMLLQRREEEERRRRGHLERLLQLREEEDRRRRELEEAQKLLQQREREERLRREHEARALQQREEEERLRRELQAQRDEEARGRREVEELQSKLLQQQREEEDRRRREDQRRWELEVEQMGRQRETHTDTQPPPEVASEVSGSEGVNQARLALLATLLRAIEKSNGGMLSHLEGPTEDDGSLPPHLPTRTDAGLPPLQRALKPPVTRVRPGMMGVMPEQHELSVIQEVEPPVDTSQIAGPEASTNMLMQTENLDQQEESDLFTATSGTLRTPAVWSGGQQVAERPSGSETSSRRSSRLGESFGSRPDLFQRIISPVSSDSGRGADDYRSPLEEMRPAEGQHAVSPCRLPDSDCLSSTTISTGSYITTDPEQNMNDKSPSHGKEEQEAVSIIPDVSLQFSQSPSIADSPDARRPASAVDSVFNDSGIQRIIDRYTRELNLSLSTAGKATDSEGSFADGSISLVSQQSSVVVAERRDEEDERPDRPSPPHTEASQESVLDPTPTVDRRENSFQPLIGRAADQSSCLAADHEESALEQLVGQPSAHSSMIAQPGAALASAGAHQGGWDSTLSRMIGRLSLHPSSDWLSGGRDFYAGQLISQIEPGESVAACLSEGPDESVMRPLVGELDESAGLQSGSSGSCVNLGVSTLVSVPSTPLFSPGDSSQNTTETSVNPDPPHQDPTSPVRPAIERTEDSFHPLLAEVTHNESVDPSMTFHQPEQEAPNSPGGPPPGRGGGDSPADSRSNPSPERFRAELPPSASPQLPLGSVLAMSPAELSVSGLNISDTAPTPGPKVRGRRSPSQHHNSKPFIDTLLGEESVINLDKGNASPMSNLLLEAASQSGILEQSEITLVSVTDTTQQDTEPPTPEESLSQEEPPTRETEELETTLTEETPVVLLEDSKATHPTLLEIEWGPSEGLHGIHEQKRRALLQRSSRRVEEIKAKAAQVKTRPESRERGKPEGKAKPGFRPESGRGTTRPKEEPAGDQDGAKSNGSKQRKSQPTPARVTEPKDVQVKNSNPEQRRRDVAEMHRRTLRLYEQLEEVKQQKAVRSRQDAHAKNREKAKEFHKKTLQKLRAKQTHH